MGQSIKISVSSAIPGMVFQNLELEVEQRKLGTSWFAVLKDHYRGLNQMDVSTMMIKSRGGKIMTALNEPIRKFMDQYKKRLKMYRVHIVKTNARTRGKLNARRQNLKRERLEEMSSPTRAATTPPQAPNGVGVAPTSGESSEPATSGRTKVKFNFPGHSRYPEDAPNFAPFVPVGDEEHDVVMEDDGDGDIDDSASQFSQDSQDPRVDLKSGVSRRFQNAASDGDILRIMNELEALNRNNKVLKVSRYIPHTMNLLNSIFRPS